MANDGGVSGELDGGSIPGAGATGDGSSSGLAGACSGPLGAGVWRLSERSGAALRIVDGLALERSRIR